MAAFLDTAPPENALTAFIRAEVLAARLEAMARAEPEVGNLWRSELSLAEAVATVGLEGARISEGDLLPRVALNGSQDPDPTGSELALGLIRVMKAPGDPLMRPVETVRRLERAAGSGMGPGIDSEKAPEGHRLSDAEIEGLFAGIVQGDMPILTAARVAAGFAQLSERANPIIERMIFMAVESSLRGRAAARSPGAEDVLRGLSGRVDANWVATPALALSHGQFRAWSPGSERGLHDLASGLNAVLGAEVGRFGLSREWLLRALAAGEGRRGRSRLTDVVHAFANAPVLTSSVLADMTGVSLRGALNILDELTRLGLLQEITRRRTARIWAVPGMGARLAARPPRRTGLQARSETSPASVRATARQRSREEREADHQAMERAFADLDAVLGRAEVILGGRGGPRG